MKRHNSYGAVAAVMGVAGALVLVAGLMPFINPGFVDTNESEIYSPRMAFLIPTLLSLPLLGISWKFNKKAQAARREFEMVKPASQVSKKLKWILFGVVILFFLWSFLW